MRERLASVVTRQARRMALIGYLALALAVSPAPAGEAAPTTAHRSDAPAPELLSFGYSASGALGRRPDQDGDLSSAPSALQLPGQAGTVVQVASGEAHSLAVTSGGQLYAFGDNYSGELGSTRNFRQKLPNPAPAPVALPGASGPVLQAAAGGGFSLALTASGQLYAFGTDRLGQLGFPLHVGKNGNAEPTPAPVPMPASAGKVVQVAAGANFALALTASGGVYSFGENHDGELGQSRNVGSEAPNPAPLPVAMPAAAGPVTQIAAGGYHALAVTAGGQLYGWGSDIHGQTGEAPNLGSDRPNATPHPIVLPAQAGAIAQIATGREHSVVLTSAGQVYTFGTNSSGQLGRAKVMRGGEAPEPTPTPVVLPGQIGTAIKVAAGAGQTFVQTSGGQLYGFGSNLYGELAVLTNYDDGASYPTPFALTFPGLSDVTVVGGGADASASFVTSLPQAPPGAPVLSGLQITRRAVELDARGRRCHTPWGADPKHRCSRTTPLRIQYSLSAVATVSFVLERKAGSILSRGTCQQEGASRNQPRCSFLVLRGRFGRAGVVGANALVFDGLIERRALTPGEYRLSAFAQVGGLTGAAQSAWFEVTA